MGLKTYCLNISMETIIMNTENSKTHEPHKFVVGLETIIMNTENSKLSGLHKFFVDLTQILYLQSLNKHVFCSKLICYT